MIFAVGGGISAYEGVLHLLHPSPLRGPSWNYAVLGLALIFEGYSLGVAWKAFRREQGSEGFWRAVRTSKNPTTYTVLFEDGAAMSGLLVALAGVFLADRLQNPLFDGAASIVIGIILAAVAVFLVYESKGLLIGEGVEPETLKNIKRLAASDPRVEKVNRALTMHFGPQTVLLAMDLQFRPGVSDTDVKEAIEAVQKRVRSRHENIKHIFIEAESVALEARRAASHGST
jgi:cation diffusion facilitator family transporter